MNKIEKLLEKHFTKLGCKCDVMDNTKQYQASLNAINEVLTLYGVVGQSEQLKCDNCKCTPTVIHNTPSGRFCEACRPVTL